MKVPCKGKYLTYHFTLYLTYGTMAGQHHEVYPLHCHGDELGQLDSLYEKFELGNWKQNQSIYSKSRSWKNKGDSFEAGSRRYKKLKI